MDTAAEPGFANEALSARVAAAVAAVEALAVELNEPQLAGDVLAAERHVEHLRRLVGAAQVDTVAWVDAERLHRIDGHRSVKAHLCHVLKVSPAEAARRAQAARALRDLPEIAAALRCGRIGLDHVQVVAQVHANPRIAGRVPNEQARFLRWADEKSFDEFKTDVIDWERTVDLDGGHRTNQRHHDNRNVRLSSTASKPCGSCRGTTPPTRGPGCGRSSTTTSKPNGAPTGLRPGPASVTPPPSPT